MLDDTQEHMPHVIKRASLTQDHFRDDAVYVNNFPIFKKENIKRNDGIHSTPSSGLTLEVALFFDAAAYKTFAPHLSYNDEALIDMLLAYLNAVSLM